jgi:hypothetical protein
MADPGCDYVEPGEESAPCGATPTQLLAVGMTAPPPETRHGSSGLAGTFQYQHLCEEHLPIVQRRMGQK